jgi:hypothetical protein
LTALPLKVAVGLAMLCWVGALVAPSAAAAAD